MTRFRLLAALSALAPLAACSDDGGSTAPDAPRGGSAGAPSPGGAGGKASSGGSAGASAASGSAGQGGSGQGGAGSGGSQGGSAGSGGSSGSGGGSGSSGQGGGGAGSGAGGSAAGAAGASGAGAAGASGAAGAGSGGGGAGVDCSTRPPPAGFARQETMFNSPFFPENLEIPSNQSVSVTTYAPLLGTFPAKKQSAYVFIDKGKYVAMQFSPSGLPTGVFGGVSWEMPTTSGGVMTVTISECPGDFASVPEAGCRTVGGASSLVWVVGPAGTAPSWACHLDSSKVYYLNAIFAAHPDYTTPTCDHDRCHWFITRAGQEG